MVAKFALRLVPKLPFMAAQIEILQSRLGTEHIKLSAAMTMPSMPGRGIAGWMKGKGRPIQDSPPPGKIQLPRGVVVCILFGNKFVFAGSKANGRKSGL